MLRVKVEVQLKNLLNDLGFGGLGGGLMVEVQEEVYGYIQACRGVQLLIGYLIDVGLKLM